MSYKIFIIPVSMIVLLLIQWQIHEFNFSMVHLFSTLFFFLINAIILFKFKILYTTLLTFIILISSNINLNLYLFPRTHIESLGISFKSFVRVDTKFNNLSKIKKNDVVMINSIHGKFAKVVSLPGEKTAINKRDWLGFFSEKQKLEDLRKDEISVLLGDTKIVIKINEDELVGKLF